MFVDLFLDDDCFLGNSRCSDSITNRGGQVKNDFDSGLLICFSRVALCSKYILYFCIANDRDILVWKTIRP